MKKYIFAAFACVCVLYAHAQERSVSITIDDVPNVHLYAADGHSSRLLKKLDSLNLPVAIFINEGHLKQNPAFEQNKKLLESWVTKPYVTVGNHSYSHSNYGEIGFEAFSEDVLKGEELTRKIAEKAGKKLDYFRFPFNGMGKDSAEQAQMRVFLREHQYISTPFTVESEDWLFTQLYEKALKEGKLEEAKAIGNRYVDLSLKLFDHFEGVALKVAGKPIKQIYLCHDNRLNTDYLPVLVQKLKEKQYRLISLGEAMADPAYKLPVHYHGNWGFSWVYRWVKDAGERRSLMQQEPSDKEAQQAYEALTKSKK
ncbi:polysaccharide deacetylase family protein [Dyadobacter fermentans]|uniref:polysaccharide deacetylase family protein n=1 Tax=Dyadobacter fermentans TaxID=94254 RepID=UPI001CC145CD|nr:polysaccharide deacetylase family protein [Dyadobacter fermentans]MBZ1358967.1 polysaccharide deacetylase family protein [Dyadobacter fermentans]